MPHDKQLPGRVVGKIAQRRGLADFWRAGGLLALRVILLTPNRQVALTSPNCARSLLRHEPLALEQGLQYVDKTTGLLRETDVVAHWAVSDDAGGWHYLHVHVECKNTTAPWVAFAAEVVLTAGVVLVAGVAFVAGVPFKLGVVAGGPHGDGNDGAHPPAWGAGGQADFQGLLDGQDVRVGSGSLAAHAPDGGRDHEFGPGRFGRSLER